MHHVLYSTGRSVKHVSLILFLLGFFCWILSNGDPSLYWTKLILRLVDNVVARNRK